MLDHAYLDQVFHEALRLHPPVTTTMRECNEEILLDKGDGSKFKVEKDFFISIPIFSIQRDPGELFKGFKNKFNFDV